VKSVGIDTNILLRLIVNDDPVQRQLVLNFGSLLNVDYRGFVSLLNLVEMDWALCSQYGFSRRQSLESIRKITQLRGVDVESHQAVKRALNLAEDRNTDFADALIAGQAAENGCSVTFTLDKRAAARIPGMEMLQ
jgi:predicted nucleic-acid-binding protein